MTPDEIDTALRSLVDSALGQGDAPYNHPDAVYMRPIARVGEDISALASAISKALPEKYETLIDYHLGEHPTGTQMAAVFERARTIHEASVTLTPYRVVGQTTSEQYALGVDIGHLVAERMAQGMTHEEVTSTLQHTLKLAEDNAVLGFNPGGHYKGRERTVVELNETMRSVMLKTADALWRLYVEDSELRIVLIESDKPNAQGPLCTRMLCSNTIAVAPDGPHGE